MLRADIIKGKKKSVIFVFHRYVYHVLTLITI